MRLETISRLIENAIGGLVWIGVKAVTKAPRLTAVVVGLLLFCVFLFRVDTDKGIGYDAAILAKQKKDVEGNVARPPLKRVRVINGEEWSDSDFAEWVATMLKMRAIVRVESGPPAKVWVGPDWVKSAEFARKDVAMLVWEYCCGGRDRAEKLTILDSGSGQTVGEYSSSGLISMK
jgi:hypothetical protein